MCPALVSYSRDAKHEHDGPLNGTPRGFFDWDHLHAAFSRFNARHYTKVWFAGWKLARDVDEVVGVHVAKTHVLGSRGA